MPSLRLPVLTSTSSMASVASAQTSNVMIDKPKPLKKQNAKKMILKIPLGIGKKPSPNNAKLAPAAKNEPNAQIAFLPNLLTSLPMNGIKMIIGKYVRAIETMFIQSAPNLYENKYV